MAKRNSIVEMKDEIAGWRRELHMNPGLTLDEKFACEFIKARLDALNIPYKAGYADYGVVATIEGNSNNSGRAIGLRADTDALPITEESGQAWASKNPGVMHACGHDGHTATLLGVAKYLSETRNFDGKVHLIFQPAEEGGRGAERMMEDGLFDDFPCETVYGLHNWPYMKVGTAGICPGPIMASVDEFDIEITGVGGHAAMPNKCVDAMVVAAQLITTLQTVISRKADPVKAGVLSFTDFHCGEGAYNVIPETAKIKGTIRTFDQETRRLIQDEMKRIVPAFCEMQGAKVDIEVTEHIDPTINDAAEAEFCADAMASLIGEDNMQRNVEPCMAGEDFGSMILNRPGAYIWVGQGVDDEKSPHNFGLHSQYYDFNDDILPITIDYFAEIVERKLCRD